MKLSRSMGFTLIEVIVVVAIVAILTAIAYPSYIDYVRRGKRPDGMNALLRVQLLQEKWRANNTTYGAQADIGISVSSDAYYDISITTGSNTATGFTVTATGRGGQASDKQGGVSCGTLSLAVSNGGTTLSPTACWVR